MTVTKKHLQIDVMTVGSFAMNAYMIYNMKTQDAILIDPGSESDRIIAHVQEKGVRLISILNTHCHIDHVAELAFVQNHFNVPFYIHKEEKPLLEGLEEQGAFFGIETKGIPDVAGNLSEGDTIQLGDIAGRVLHTPGHSPGSISFHLDNHLFVGDCIFMDSIGRTDLYKGNYDQLIKSIKEKIFTLPDDTILYPGHGPTTTVGREKKYNPFFH